MSNINCPEKNKAIASFITNASDPATRTWDLSSYRTAGMAEAGGTWRIIETGANLLYYSGVVAADGILAPEGYQEPATGTASRSAKTTTPCGFSSEFVGHYYYDGFMEQECYYILAFRTSK